MNRDLTQELVADIEQIEDNVDLYLSGRKSAYQTVAIQLRNVLLRGRRALLGRVAPDIRLHPFRPSNTPPDIIEGLRRPSGKRRVVNLLDVRGGLKLSTGGGAPLQVVIHFDEPASLTLTQWLDQWIITPDLTVGALIEGIADEEVAHTQDHFGDAVKKASEWKFSGRAAGHELMHAVIVALGQYVAQRARDVALAKEASA